MGANVCCREDRSMGRPHGTFSFQLESGEESRVRLNLPPVHNKHLLDLKVILMSLLIPY